MKREAKTKRKARLLLLCLAAFWCLTACAVKDAPESAAGSVLVDPSGAQIRVPARVDTLAVLGPSLAEMVAALGYGEKVAACDASSVGVEGLKEDALVLDLVSPDMEQLFVLKPDVLFVTNLSLYDQENPYQTLIDAGTCVVCVPTSDSIADIQSDIAFVASVLGAEEKGQEVIRAMQEQVDQIARIGKTIKDKKTVYFEIAAAPGMYSFGDGVFLNELLELAGAENILASESGWIGVTEEAVVSADPDVILTNVDYLEDPVGEILSRPGWEAVAAVRDKAVYSIDKVASSRPDQNVVKALRQIAAAVYPEYYGE